MNSSLSIAGIHIGDSASDVESAMNKYKASCDSDYSIAGVLESYDFTYNGKNVQVIFKYSGGILERINATLSN